MRIFLIGHKSPDLDSVAATVQYKEYLETIGRYEGSELIPVRAGDVNNETTFIFNKYNVQVPAPMDAYSVDSTDAFVLVDHNEESQRHEKVVGTQVLEIVDHHKINVNFTSPVRIDVKPIGSTSSLIFELFKMYDHTPSKETLGLMLSGILSDTVGLKSNTTTGFDSQIAHEIAKELNADIEELTFEIFKAKSDLSGLSITQIATKDYKVFDFSGTHVFINQVETVEPETVLSQKNELIDALNEVKSREGATLGFIVVTDILKINSQVIYSTDTERIIVEKAFTTVGNDNIADIGPKMSRKKDIAPAIEEAIKA